MNPYKALPLERCVDCDCADYGMAQPVLLYNRWGEQHVYACLRCGAVECVHPMGDEPRGAGPVSGNNFVMPLSVEVREWLAQWPRLLTLGCHSNQPLWSPARTLFESRAELNHAIAAAEESQVNLPPAGRLLQNLGRTSIGAPPPGLPPYLKMYRNFWAVLGNPAELGALLDLAGCTR